MTGKLVNWYNQSMAYEPVPRRPVSDHVFDALREDVLVGRF